jgi:hypothetical protein
MAHAVRKKAKPRRIKVTGGERALKRGDIVTLTRRGRRTPLTIISVVAPAGR